MTYYKILLILSLFFMNTTLFSQNKASLQKEYKQLKSEIKKLENELKSTKKKRKIGLKELRLINSKIKKRKGLIQNINVQLNNIEGEVKLKEKDISNIQSEINTIKKEYAKLIVWMNRNHNKVSKLAFVLESTNFKDAYNRIRYLKKYGDYKNTQQKYLQSKINSITSRINSLNQVKKSKQALLQTNNTEKNNLSKEKKKRDFVVSSLGKELKDLKTKIKSKNKKARQVNSKIKKIIEDEIRKQRLAMSKKAKSEGKDAIDISKTPEGRLSSSFKASKGSLPWPVGSGKITSKFGRQPHPDDNSIMIENNGIDIKTTSSASVKSIYAGKVVRIFKMPSYQTCLMVNHGDYFTVYSYLSSTSVKAGDQIRANQTIGRAGYDPDHGYYLVNLQIWHYQNKQNPKSWIRKK